MDDLEADNSPGRLRSRFLSSPALRIDYADDIMSLSSSSDDEDDEDEEEVREVVRRCALKTYLLPRLNRSLSGHRTVRHSRSISFPGRWDINECEEHRRIPAGPSTGHSRTLASAGSRPRTGYPTMCERFSKQ